MAKIGELVIIIGNTKNHQFPIGKTVKVFRHMTVQGSSYYDCCDDDGNCSMVSVNDVVFFKLNNNIMKAMKDAVLTTAKGLLKANNTVTTLEIKTELRRDYPYYYWDQATVSKYMADLAGDGIFNYKDNGLYRTYSLAKVKVPTATKTVMTKSTVKVSKGTKLVTSAALTMIKNGGFQIAEFKNGRVITLNQIKSQKKSAFGYLSPKIHNVAKITVSGKTYEIV